MIRGLGGERLAFLDRVSAAFDEIQNGGRVVEQHAADSAVVSPTYVVTFPVRQPITRVSVDAEDDEGYGTRERWNEEIIINNNKKLCYHVFDFRGPKLDKFAKEEEEEKMGISEL
jgi:hypothetical protein